MKLQCDCYKEATGTQTGGSVSLSSCTYTALAHQSWHLEIAWEEAFGGAPYWSLFLCLYLYFTFLISVALSLPAVHPTDLCGSVFICTSPFWSLFLCLYLLCSLLISVALSLSVVHLSDLYSSISTCSALCWSLLVSAPCWSLLVYMYLWCTLLISIALSLSVGHPSDLCCSIFICSAPYWSPISLSL